MFGFDRFSSMWDKNLEPKKKKSQSLEAVNFGFQVKDWAYLHYNAQNKFEEILKKPKTDKLPTPTVLICTLFPRVTLVYLNRNKHLWQKNKTNMKLDDNRSYDRLVSKPILRKTSSNFLLLYFSTYMAHVMVCVTKFCISLCKNCFIFVLVFVPSL